MANNQMVKNKVPKSLSTVLGKEKINTYLFVNKEIIIDFLTTVQIIVAKARQKIGNPIYF